MATVAADGTTGAITVEAGSHAVGEVFTLGDGGDYVSTIVCAVGDTIVGQGSGIVLADVPVGAGQNVVCTITNTQKGTIVIGKTARYGKGTFYFSRSGDWSGDFSIGPVYDGRTKYATFEDLLPSPHYTVAEKQLPSSWVFKRITCSITVPVSGGTSTWGTSGKTVNINLKPGETVKCVYLNEEPTRPMAFWSTHYTFARDTWLLIPPEERSLCAPDTKDLGRPNEDSSNVPGVGLVPLTVQSMEGGFWSNLARTTERKKRSPLDQARLLLVQQLVAAMLNVMADTHLNGDTWNAEDPVFRESIQFIYDAKAAYCGSDMRSIMTKAAELFFFNHGGEKIPLPPGMSPRAEPKTARKVAAEKYWDSMP